MVERPDREKVAPLTAPASAGSASGRAAGVVLARAIFAAAVTEHLGRRIVLLHGGKVLAESS